MVAKQNKQREARKLSVRVPGALWSRLRHLIVDEETSVQAFLIAAIEDRLAEKIVTDRGRRTGIVRA